jgi:hypothetical protein
MYDLNQIKPKAEFKYWFARKGITNQFDLFAQKPNSTGRIKQTRIGVCSIPLKSKDNITPDENFKDFDNVDFDAVKADFETFYKTRPEYVVGISVPKEKLRDPEENIAVYERLLTGCLLLQFNNDDKAIKAARRCLEWLRETDFYEAPASGNDRFHEAFPNGLIQHTLKVVNHIVALMQLRKFCSVAPYEAVLVALVHDWCKIGIYEQYLRNVKDETTGVWSHVSAYRYKSSEWPYGHGCSSMVLAKKYLQLTEEMALAIRWHMSAYSVAQNESYDLSEASSKFPMVHLLQWADQASVTIYGQEV